MSCAGPTKLFAKRKSHFVVRMQHPEMTCIRKKTIYDGSKIHKILGKLKIFEEKYILWTLGCSEWWVVSVCITERFGGKYVFKVRELGNCLFFSETMHTVIVCHDPGKNVHQIFLR